MPSPFLVVATQNPIEEEGTYVLPEAQMDRFLVKVVLGYPEPADEVEVVARAVDGRQGAPEPPRVGVRPSSRFFSMPSTGTPGSPHGRSSIFTA